MNEEELRNEIYKRLGVEKGSLSSESGNDWQRAENEILEEYKQKIFTKENNNAVDYLTIDKANDLFKIALELRTYDSQDAKVAISQREDLSKTDLFSLIKTGNKEVHINLAKYQKLTIDMIDILLQNSVYMTKKHLLKQQDLSEEQRAIIHDAVLRYPDIYNRIT